MVIYNHAYQYMAVYGQVYFHHQNLRAEVPSMYNIIGIESAKIFR